MKQRSLALKTTMTFTAASEIGHYVGSRDHDGSALVYFPQINRQRVQVRLSVQAIKMLSHPSRSSAENEALQPQTNHDKSTTFPPFPLFALWISVPVRAHSKPSISLFPPSPTPSVIWPPQNNPCGRNHALQQFYPMSPPHLSQKTSEGYHPLHEPNSKRFRRVFHPPIHLQD
jgi:hypothetical protein